MKKSIKEIPANKRGTVRLLENQLGVSRATVHRLIRKEKIMQPANIRLRPQLTEEHKIARIDYALSWRKPNGLYDDMLEVVHVDEKWFFTEVQRQRVYLLEGEERPNKTAKHKQHIPKLMFLAANARPRWDYRNNMMFDGKLGLWPIAEQLPAQRASRNRARGTLEWKSVSVTKEVYTTFLFDKVVVSILSNWPRGRNTRKVRIQQDNAKPHLSPDEFKVIWEERKEQMQSEFADGQEFDITLYNQAAQSPDTNINDLCFFASIQSLQQKERTMNLGELVARVTRCYEEYDWRKLNNAFLTLQCVLNEILICNGDNNYKLPHISKAKLEREGQLPMSIHVAEEAIQWVEGAPGVDDMMDEDDEDE